MEYKKPTLEELIEHTVKALVTVMDHPMYTKEENTAENPVTKEKSPYTCSLENLLRNHFRYFADRIINGRVR